MSALISGGKPRKLVTRLLEGHQVVASSQMLVELADVLMGGKFEVTDMQVERFLVILTSRIEMVDIKHPPVVILADPDDDKVLETALRGKAEYVISGDKHLLDLTEYNGIEIVTVAKMVELLKKA